MKVKDLMTKHICCAAPDMTIENVSKLMSGADIGIIPVCGSEGLCGIVTDRDIVIRGLSKGYGTQTPVESIMTKTVYTISPDSDVKEAAKTMGANQVRRLPVMSGREIVGMVSMGDLARCGKLDNEVAKAETDITSR